jgi:ABC-type multidrug transport system fused ATPase/permease subunit
VVIAHRLSTVRDADCIYVLNKGVLSESGRHEELLNRGGLYAELVQTQLAAERHINVSHEIINA